MELSGEEKKLQALFSELKAAEEQATPRFATVWNRSAIKPARARAFAPALVALALVACVVLSIAVLSRYRQQSPPNAIVKIETPAPIAQSSRLETPGALPAAPTPAKEITAPRHKRAPRRRDSIQLAANRKLTQEAKAISEWESPTSALLSSPSDSLFSSLPQLNENANGLQTYLPNRPK